MARESRTVTVAAIAVGAGLLVVAGGLTPYQALEFAGLLGAALFTSALIAPQPAAENRGTMPQSFLFDFTSLLLFGAGPATLVAAAGVMIKGRLTDSARVTPPRRVLFDALVIMVATPVAGIAYQTGAAMGLAAWPLRALPILAAAVLYALIRVAATQVLAPLFEKRAIDGAWPTHVLRECPGYVMGASLAVGLAELIDHRLWSLLPAAAVPLYCAHRFYEDYVTRVDADHRRREVIDALEQGMCVVDANGYVTLWSEALERLLGCSNEGALNRALVSALPALRETALPRAVTDTLTDRRSRSVPCLALASGSGTRFFQVRVLPVADGATLLWLDITERTRAEESRKRDTDRLTLAAEGAQDGLWEWDLRTQECYFSGRWRAMLGMSDLAGIGSPQEWIDRVHPEDVASLKDALKALGAGQTAPFEHEHRIRHEDGTYRWFLCRGVVAGSGRRPARIAGSLTDTTDRVMDRERLRTAAFLDPLTGLPNRAEFLQRLARRLDDLKRRMGDRFAVLYLDVDRLKLVNDSLGHPAGDELLIAVSRRLESCLRPADCVGRLGGDEFAILLNAIGDEQQANAVAFRIQDALNAPLTVRGREVFTSASIGIAVGDVRYQAPDEMMRDADTAMYHAKAHGKARHELFDSAMLDRARDRLGLENDLRHAVNTNDFQVHYQPIVSLASGMCVGFESLVRWTRNGEPISPATFIPIAEELGVIEPLGTWVLQQACETFAAWQRRFPDAGLNCITVNASSRQLTQQNFPSLVEEAVQKSGLAPGDLRIEVTETALMDSPHVAAAVLTQLREFGVKIYLDDFGTGCSSLSHLHKLPVDALKIDRSFVNSLLLPDRPAIVESILALARTLNTSVVAEGIESDVQARELERLGCTHAQGYLFSRPLTAAAAESLIVANLPLGPKRVAEAVVRPEAFAASA